MFLRRDGRTASANELRPGDSLMPLYRELRRGYECVYQPISGHLLATHRLADEWNIRRGIYVERPGTHRHHIDIDRRNNKPVNIERMGAAEHIRLHNTDTFGEDFDGEEHGAAIRAAFERLAINPGWRERFSQAQSQRAQAAWVADGVSRRAMQAEIARQIKIPSEITAQSLRRALDDAGSIRGAARHLNCDRSVFRRFPEVLAGFRGTPGRNHKVVAVRQLPGEHDVYCLTVAEAGNFGLEAGVFVHNCGIIVNVTPLEPEWEGHVTLEFSNTTPLPAKIYANEGVAQMLFFESDEVCATSYADRGGKYQRQKGVTLPKA
jgi:hypothetical protein